MDAQHQRSGAWFVMPLPTWLTGPTTNAPEDRDALVDRWLLHSLTDGHHHPRGIVTQHQRQHRPIASTILADLQVQGAIDRYRMHPHEDLLRAGSGCGHLLPPQHLRVAKLPDHDGFHATSSSGQPSPLSYEGCSP